MQDFPRFLASFLNLNFPRFWLMRIEKWWDNFFRGSNKNPLLQDGDSQLTSFIPLQTSNPAQNSIPRPGRQHQRQPTTPNVIQNDDGRFVHCKIPEQGQQPDAKLWRSLHYRAFNKECAQQQQRRCFDMLQSPTRRREIIQWRRQARCRIRTATWDFTGGGAAGLTKTQIESITSPIHNVSSPRFLNNKNFLLFLANSKRCSMNSINSTLPLVRAHWREVWPMFAAWYLSSWNNECIFLKFSSSMKYTGFIRNCHPIWGAAILHKCRQPWRGLCASQSTKVRSPYKSLDLQLAPFRTLSQQLAFKSAITAKMAQQQSKRMYTILQRRPTNEPGLRQLQRTTQWTWTLAHESDGPSKRNVSAINSSALPYRHCCQPKEGAVTTRTTATQIVQAMAPIVRWWRRQSAVILSSATEVICTAVTTLNVWWVAFLIRIDQIIISIKRFENGYFTMQDRIYLPENPRWFSQL